jgi:hypothetical protein
LLFATAFAVNSHDAAHCRRATSMASPFAMRRSGVQIPSAPPTPTIASLLKPKIRRARASLELLTAG